MKIINNIIFFFYFNIISTVVDMYIIFKIFLINLIQFFDKDKKVLVDNFPQKPQKHKIILKKIFYPQNLLLFHKVNQFNQ